VAFQFSPSKTTFDALLFRIAVVVSHTPHSLLLSSLQRETSFLHLLQLPVVVFTSFNMSNPEDAAVKTEDPKPEADCPAAPAPLEPMIKSATTSAEPTEDGSVDDLAAEEEALFRELERAAQEKEHEEALHPDQPKDIKAAPRLLQKALEVGEVKLDDSEEEDAVGKNKSESPVKSEEAKNGAEPAAASPQAHVHERVSF
jgi:hypothetical protein